MSKVEDYDDNPQARLRKKQKYYGKTAKLGAVWSMLRQGGNELIGIPVSMIMARLLSPYEFGVSAAASLFIHLAARLTQFGFGAGLVRIKEMRPDHASSVYVISQLIGIATFAVLYAIGPFMGVFFRSPEAGTLLQLAALAFVISPLGVVPAALFQRRMQFRYTVAADWIDTIIGAVVTIATAYRGYGYWSPVIGHLVALSVRIVLQLYLSEWRPSLVASRAALRDLLRFGLGVQAKRLLEYAASNLDNFVAGRVLGMTALGIYSKAFTTMNKVVFRLTLGQAPFRIFSIIHEDRERFARAYSRLILSITLIGYPILTGCIVAAEPLFVVLYGRRWLDGVFPFQLLCVGGMLKLLNNYSSQANEAAGNIWPQVRRQGLGTALVLVGSAIGAVYGGIAGVALGVLVAWGVFTVSLQILLRQATGLSWRAMLAPQWPSLVCSVLVGAVAAAAGVGLKTVVANPHAWQLLLVEAAAGGIVYAAFLLFGPFSNVRNLVLETVEDLFPAGPARLVTRFCGAASRQA